MHQLDVFLREHATVHAAEVTGTDHSMEWVYARLPAEQLRARPHGLNSIAWLLWHIARVEDACISGIVVGAPQLLDDAWAGRLGVDVRSDGEGMTRDAVAALSEAIDLDALRAYRNAVGTRTRELVATLWPDRWNARLSDGDIARALASGAASEAETEQLRRFPRDGMLWWWALEHTHYHLGQMAMVRGVLTR